MYVRRPPPNMEDHDRKKLKLEDVGIDPNMEEPDRKKVKMEDVGIDPTASRICLFVIGDIVLGYTDSNFPFLRIYLR